jgi:hypothetical protein
MDVFSTELGNRLRFVKTSEFQGGVGVFKPPLSMPLKVFVNMTPAVQLTQHLSNGEMTNLT